MFREVKTRERNLVLTEEERLRKKNEELEWQRFLNSLTVKQAWELLDKIYKTEES